MLTHHKIQYKGEIMGFRDNINDFLGLCNKGSCPFRITLLGSVGAYIEGVIRVCDVKSSQIIIEVKGAKLLFLGNSLTVSSYCEKDLTIKGGIEKILWQK